MSEAPAKPPGTMAAPASGVKVRMYRRGFGDCFLLAFPTGGPRPCYLLVDCGVRLGFEDAAETMKEVTASLYEATGGRIDVLVAIREHWDHVSGFQQAKEVFDRIEIGEVWAPWTEDPNDPVAQRLRARRELAVEALIAAAQELRQCGEEDGAGSLESVLGLFGEIGKDGRPAASAQTTMAYVLGRGHPPRYLRPGDRPDLPGVDGACIYVLGPPGVTPPGALPAPVPAAAVDAGSPPGAGAAPKALSFPFPFDTYFRVPVDGARQDPFFQASYFGAPGHPDEHEMDWRQIETEWLSSAKPALQGDGKGYNTGLSLALELSPGGKVLLFATDSQTESWLSWHHLQWPSRGGSGAPQASDVPVVPDVPAAPVTVAELLSRTVLYKVGHHASFIGASRDGGLELMTDPGLTVMIPVDIPFPSLLQDLLEKAKGRVLRADSGAPARSPGLSSEEWKDFERRCAVNPDYVELTVGEPEARPHRKKKA